MDIDGAWLSDALEAETIRNYCARGRRLENLTNDDVLSGWVDAYRSWYLDRRNEKANINEEDYRAEFLLRGLKQPHSPELEKLQAEIRARGPIEVDDLSPDGLARLDEIGDLLARSRARH